MLRSDNVLPRWGVTRWLIESRGEVPAEIRPTLVHGLYGSLPIFLGGVFNTILVSSLVATRIATPVFILWAAIEICLALFRLPLLVAGNRAAKNGSRAFIDIYILLAVVWAASVGFGCFITLMSGDWVAASLVCLSAAAMAGGIAFRNFAAPRLVTVMLLLSLGPCAIAGPLSGAPILLAMSVQIPMYIYAMTAASYRLNAMLVKTLRSEHENDRRARHDVLTGLLNRAGFEDEIARRSGDGDLKATLFYVDLDGFKSVNDNFGHAAGDRLLVEAGKRISSVIRPRDVVARIGGDEFVVLTTHIDRLPAGRTAQRIVDVLSQGRFELGNSVAQIGASVGVAMLPEHGTDFAALFTAADKALYEAKHRGRCQFSIASNPPHLHLASQRDEALRSKPRIADAARRR